MADTPTLVTLMDLITAQQREINDIEVLLSGHGTRLDSHDTDIEALENPPSGVPPALLSWLATHSIREVDAILDSDLDVISSDLATHDSDILQLQTDLATEISDRTVGDTDLSNVDIDLQAQITANLDTLTQEVSDRSALSVTVSEGIDTINDRVDNIESDLAALSTTTSTETDAISSQLASTNSALQTAQTQINLLMGIGVDPAGAQAAQITALTSIANDAAADIATEIVDRTNADIALQTAINSVGSSVSGIQTGLTAEINTRVAADLDIQSDVAALTASISGIGGLISSETAARIAADTAINSTLSTHASDISDNADAIILEENTRTSEDITLAAGIATNTSSITTHTGQIATNTADITQVKAKYGVVKDGGGYITQWWINDETVPPGSFKLRNLNNDVRLQNPNYVGKYFPPVNAISFTLPVTYDTDWGGGTTNDFHGVDGNDYTRNVKVFSTLTIGPNGSCLMGVDNSTGGSLSRVGQVLTTFKVDFSGSVNRYLSLWYRIKNTAGDTTQRWFPVMMMDNTMAGARTYEYVRGQNVSQINVTTDKIIEFGLTVLNNFDATIASAANDIIYGGSVTVTALNMVTIS